ncbi:ATP-binding cassette domain-containing protein [Caldimonas sp. KR1-144]|uniref:ATP-binding cassette domain-containing protein n=1 Tax=Caldimonas sp. KR1-144 TaxID=3400911 RepID=UPI003C0A6B89
MAPPSAAEASGPSSSIFATVAPYVWRFRHRTLAALALLILAKACAVLVPMALKAIVDRFSEFAAQGMAAALQLPVWLLLGYALLRFAGTLFTELRDLVFSRVTQHVTSAVSQRCFERLLALGSRFHGRRQTGALIRDVDRGTAGVGFLLGAGLFTMVPTLVEFIAVLAIMASRYPLSFSAAMLATFVAYATYTGALTQRRELRQRRVNEIDSRAHAHLVDRLLNLDSVRAYAREAYERRRYGELWQQLIDNNLANQRALSALHIGQGGIIAIGVATVMLLAGQRTMAGDMTVGDLVLVNAYVIQICLPLNALGFVVREARDARVNAERLLQVLDEPVEVRDAPNAPALALRGAAIRFEEVDFGYEPGRPILRHFSLDIAPGSTVAVVGGSGSGKSTLARLLLRLYDVDAGRVLIDAQDVRNVSLASLREAIGVVPQDTTLFNGTVGENIAYGRLGAPAHAIVDAAAAAQVHEFIASLPQQYDTPVGERGVALSGGEKQRIAIARAFLKNPAVLILDEATSALDTRAERAIQEQLDRLARDRTTLVIAHRLSTIVDADEIIVLDKGRIVERGRHDALLELDGLYAQLWKLQLQQREFERLERRLAREPVHLGVLIALALDTLRPLTQRRGVTVYTAIDVENASVSGDPGALTDVIHNLCHWALNATAHGGRIELSLRRAGPNARLEVHSEHAPGGVAAAPAEPGATLDPLVLRSIVERQGGTLQMHHGDDGGTTMVALELPLRALNLPSPAPGAAPSLPPPEPPPAPPGEALLAGARVMAIDDNADALESIGLLLRLEGASVLAYDSGEAALAWLAQQPSSAWPDLLVCDIALGGHQDGLAVVRRIRALELERGVALGRRLPAIALTGLAQPDDRMRTMLAGFQAHLAKPVDARELLVTARGLLARRAA